MTAVAGTPFDAPGIKDAQVISDKELQDFNTLKEQYAKDLKTDEAVLNRTKEITDQTPGREVRDDAKAIVLSERITQIITSPDQDKTAVGQYTSNRKHELRRYGASYLIDVYEAGDFNTDTLNRYPRVQRALCLATARMSSEMLKQEKTIRLHPKAIELYEAMNEQLGYQKKIVPRPLNS
ncbi:MAG: hypothetical protein Fur003_2300 [Candidatus Dojkabacteria bacterium]